MSALAVHGVMSGARDKVHSYRLNRFDMLTPDGQRGAVNLSKENRDELTPAPQLVVAQRAANNTWMVNHPTFGALSVKRVVENRDDRG